jgi:hypothetical protein
LVVKAANGRRHSPFTYYTEKISLSSFQELAFQGKELAFQGKELAFQGKELAFQGKRAVFFPKHSIPFHSIPFHSIIQSIPLSPSPRDKS